MQYHYVIQITHLAHFVQISSTMVDSLSNCLFVQLLTANIQNIGYLCIGMEMHSPLVGISADMFCSRLTSHFLCSPIFLNSVL